MKKEIWKDIKDYENYSISNFGKVKNNNTQKILMSRDNGNGYKIIRLWKNNKEKVMYIHRLIAIYFIQNLDNKPEVNHINGIKYDNSIENLEWVTRSENEIHKRQILGFKNIKTNNKKIKVNGIEFNSIKEASIHFKRNNNYFNNVIQNKKINPKRHKNWNIEIIEKDQ